MRPRAARFASAALVLLLACGGGDSFTPTEETVAGTYEAASFTVTQLVKTD